MVITLEMVVACVAFIGTLITVYINGQKIKKDHRDKVGEEKEKLREEIEWRVKVEKMLEQIQQNNIDLKSFQELLTKYITQTELNTKEIATIWRRFDELKAIMKEKA